MAIRPTRFWREGIEEEARQVASGELREEWASMVQLFPGLLLSRTDGVLQAFEEEVSALVNPADADVLEVVKRAVIALNSIHADFDHDAYATGERDQLCSYIDDVISESGVDVDDLARRSGISRNEIIDKWREW